MAPECVYVSDTKMVKGAKMGLEVHVLFRTRDGAYRKYSGGGRFAGMDRISCQETNEYGQLETRKAYFRSSRGGSPQMASHSGHGQRIGDCESDMIRNDDPRLSRGHLSATLALQAILMTEQMHSPQDEVPETDGDWQRREDAK